MQIMKICPTQVAEALKKADSLLLAKMVKSESSSNLIKIRNGPIFE